jgi:PPOX class probable F420-dependent enzyme
LTNALRGTAGHQGPFTGDQSLDAISWVAGRGAAWRAGYLILRSWQSGAKASRDIGHSSRHPMNGLVSGVAARIVLRLDSAAMSRPLSPEARRLLDGANFAHFATLMPDGEPKVEPVWVGRDGDFALIATDGKSLKARNVAKDARVALSIVAQDCPYEQLLIRGHVEVRPDDDLAVLDALSQKYTGQPFGRRRWSQRVVLAVVPEVVRYYLSPLSSLRQQSGGTP